MFIYCEMYRFTELQIAGMDSDFTYKREMEGEKRRKSIMGRLYSERLGQYDQAILNDSLLTMLRHPSCAKSISLRAELNSGQFQRASHEGNSFYFLNEQKELLSIAFPAKLVVNGQHTQIGPYFTLKNHETTLNPSALQSVKAVFELHQLSTLGLYKIPADAIDCSRTAMDVFQTVYKDEESKVGDYFRSDQYETSTSFLRDDPLLKEQVFIIHTKPLFENRPSSDPNNNQYRYNSNLVEKHHHQVDITIPSMKDPEGIFSSNEICKDFFVIVPNVRDGDGCLIMPDDYGSKLENGSIVMVNVHLKLEVDVHCHRNYQLILNSMQVLPISDLYEII